MLNPKSLYYFLVLAVLFTSGCIKVKDNRRSALLLKTSDATIEDLEKQIADLSRVESMRAKMYLKFEDNSFAEFGAAEVYRRADGDIIVQRPASIRMKVEVPVIGTDVAALTSDGEKFRVAILQDGGDGSNKSFIIGTNDEDYSMLQKKVTEIVSKKKNKKASSSVKAFSNLRPQHFTDALLVAPIDKSKYVYIRTSHQEEVVDFKLYKKKDPLGWVIRGYYFFDEYEKTDEGMKLKRRFWFDRVGGALLSRLQIFDDKGEIESDITYGKRGPISKDPNLRLPLLVTVTRPKERYSMKLEHSAPNGVKTGRKYPKTAFVLENDWNLKVVDLDQQLKDARNGVQSTGNLLFE